MLNYTYGVLILWRDFLRSVRYIWYFSRLLRNIQGILVTLYSWPWNSCSSSGAVALNSYSHPTWVKNSLQEGWEGDVVRMLLFSCVVTPTDTLHIEKLEVLGCWDPLKPAFSTKVTHSGCQKKPIQTTLDLMEDIQDDFFKQLAKISDFD